MARSIAFHRTTRPRSLRERRIAAFSTPTVGRPDEVPTRLRWALDQRCLTLGVTLTKERRALALIFDETDAPLSAGEVWGRARALGLKASRSHVYQLIKSLLALGVLIVAEVGQSIRYAAPLVVRMTLRAQDDQAPLAIDDPHAVEALAGALMRAGRKLEGHDIEINLIERPAPSGSA